MTEELQLSGGNRIKTMQILWGIRGRVPPWSILGSDMIYSGGNSDGLACCRAMRTTVEGRVTKAGSCCSGGDNKSINETEGVML